MSDQDENLFRMTFQEISRTELHSLLRDMHQRKGEFKDSLWMDLETGRLSDKPIWTIEMDEE